MITRAGRPRRLWLDTRLLIGGGLVLASIAGVALLVGAADRSALVYAAAHPLAVGDRIDGDDLTVEAVRLGPAADRYLLAEQLPAEGAVVSRAIAEGELLPVAALGDTSSIDSASMVLETSGVLPRDVAAGMPVDVWASPRDESGEFGPPSVIADATVVRTVDEQGLASSGTVAVELLVPRSDVADVLDAVAGGDAISLVPGAASLGGAS